MASQQSEDSKGTLNEVRAAAKSLQKALSQRRDKHPDLPRIEVRVAETERNSYGQSPGSIAKFVIIIIADTAEHAFEHAKELEDQGCICTSSGETEVTCDCGDQ